MTHGFINLIFKNGRENDKVKEFVSKYAVLVNTRKDFQRDDVVYTYQCVFSLSVHLCRELKNKFPQIKYDITPIKPVKVQRYSHFEGQILVQYMCNDSVEYIAKKLKVKPTVVTDVIKDIRWRSGKKLIPDASKYSRFSTL